MILNRFFANLFRRAEKNTVNAPTVARSGTSSRSVFRGPTLQARSGFASTADFRQVDSVVHIRHIFFEKPPAARKQQVPLTLIPVGIRLSHAISRTSIGVGSSGSGIILPDFAPIRLAGLSRISLSLAEHLGTYGQIDVALDTFPYNGTTTTCEALWMCVSVVTWTGRRHAGRVGASILRQVGLSDLVARDLPGYLSLARSVAADGEYRAGLREILRAGMRRSTLMNPSRLAREMETAYRDIWKNWCRERSGTGAA